MNNQIWSWVLTIVGLTGFILAGRKVWWCWYVNIACQALWFTYAIVTEQYGFIVASLAYTVVFTQNAIKWTKEHKELQTYINYNKNDIIATEKMHEALNVNRKNLEGKDGVY